MDETLPNICKQLASVLDVGYSEIFSWDVGESRLVTMARHYEAVWRYGRGPATELNRASATKTALDRDTYLYMQVEDRPNVDEAAYMRRIGAVAMLLIPIPSKGQQIGAIRAFYTSAPANPEDLHSPETIARLREAAQDSLINLLNRTDRIMTDSLTELTQDINHALASDWCDLSVNDRKNNKMIVLARIGNGVWIESPAPYINLARYDDLARILEEQSIIPSSDN